jgi:8-oxo-dGTP pyrophosphatase MutT (NUDIX family)
MAQVTEIPLPTPTARIDFAATYGGFQLGFGGFLLLCARREAWLEAGLRAAAAVLIGISGFRILGLLFPPGPPGRVIYWGLLIELSGLAASWWAAGRAGGRRIADC